MTELPPDPAAAFAAFAALDRRLASRRLAQFDLRSRAVIAAITLLLSGFFYWQTRVPLDGQVRAHGASAGALWLALALGIMAAVAGGLAFWRQGMLLARVVGPEWLALPIEPSRVMRHLLSESRIPAQGAVPPAIAVLLAGAGLMPAWWLVLLAAAFAVAWLECTRAGAAMARRLAVRGTRDERLPLATRLLASARRLERSAPRAAPQWRTEPRWRALQRLDALLTSRHSSARTRALLMALLFALGMLAWFSGASPELRRAQAFAAFLPACSLLGAWAIARVCADPASAHRPLPLALSDVWRARFTTMAAALLVVVLANAALAHGFPAGPRVGMTLTWLACGLSVSTLGLHYGLTLQPRANAAENLYFAWLGITLTASWMIPLLGWGVLLAGIVHSTMRLPRWRTPEVG